MKSEASSFGATRVVELTHVGRGAVAVVLVAGPAAVYAVDGLFHRVQGRRLAEVPIGQIVLGHWGAADGEELIVCRRAVDQLEIHCHGGLAAVRGVIDPLTERGCRQTTWQEWLQQQATDRLCAAAQIVLSAAPTARTAAILIDQYDGALSRVMHDTIADVSAGRWEQAERALGDVMAFRDLGLHLTSPWQVVLAGRTNVGKSSLLNALAGYQRAIVSPLAGTTRDVLTVTTAIDGWPVQLLDTAGLRDTADELEAAGVALANTTLSKADLVLVVDDKDDFSLELPTKARRIYVRNKSDLVSPSARDLKTSPLGRGQGEGLSSSGDLPSPQPSPFGRGSHQVISTSALTGEGIAALVTTIGQTLVPNVPEGGSAVPFQADQIAAMERARSAIDARNSSIAMAALQSVLAI